MERPVLEFVEDPYDEQTARTLIDGFQKTGCAVLPHVFTRDTVDPFLQQLQAAVYDNGVEYTMPDDLPHHVWAAQASRVRQILVPALTHTLAAGLPSLSNSMWIIQPEGRPDLVPAWHKDREPEGMPGSEYQYPKDVFMGFYFEDLTEEKGPLRLIPGSHWDSRITPYTGEPDKIVLANKEDGVLLDQRVWHCGVPRTVPGIRILVVYAYYLAPVHYGHVPKMPRAQREIWMRQTKRDDQAFWGGPFVLPEDQDQSED